MHDDQPLETGAGEMRPDFRRCRRRRTTGEVEKIDLERISQSRGVHVPVVQVEAPSEAQHDITDLLAVPQHAYHLFGRRVFCRSCHQPISLNSPAVAYATHPRHDPT